MTTVKSLKTLKPFMVANLCYHFSFNNTKLPSPTNAAPQFLQELTPLFLFRQGKTTQVIKELDKVHKPSYILATPQHTLYISRYKPYSDLLVKGCCFTRGDLWKSRCLNYFCILYTSSLEVDTWDMILTQLSFLEWLLLIQGSWN